MKQSSTRRQRAWTRRPTMTLAEIATVARVKARLKGERQWVFDFGNELRSYVVPPYHHDDFLDCFRYAFCSVVKQPGVVHVQRLV